MSNPKEDMRLKLVKALKAGKVPHDFTVPGLNPEFKLFDYQKIGIAWLYLTPKALLADSTGTGKTIHGLGLLQLLKSKGKLSNKERAIVIVPAISVFGSWKADGFDKFFPGLKYEVGRGTKDQRLKIYKSKNWEVLLTNYEMVLRDIDLLEQLNFQYVIMDEADAVRNHSTQTAAAVKRLTSNARRVVAMTATPIQNALMDLHGILEAIGLDELFGSKQKFANDYHRFKMVRAWYGGKSGWTKKRDGYKNLKKLKAKLQPYYLRRTYKDLDDVDIPELRTQIRRVSLTKEQRKLYKQIQQGFMWLNESSSVIEIRNAALRLRQVCTTTATVDDTDHSSKFDDVMHKLEGDWAEEKSILFVNWLPGVDALSRRLTKAGIGHVCITGNENNQSKREALRQKFWNDPDCKVLIGTTAIEKSINLQCARIQVNLDLLGNPARVTQFAGRHRRVGSRHSRVYVFSYVTEGTIEEGLLKMQMERQALSDHIFDDVSEVIEKLDKKDLLKLIGQEI